MDKAQAARNAVIKDDVGTLRRLLQLPAPAPDGSRPGIDAISKDWRTLLHLAAGDGSADCLQLLLEIGADSEAGKAVPSWTPLHLAATSGHLRCVHVLIRNGAKLEARDLATNRTPLHCAATRGCTDCVRALLSAGADIDARDRAGGSALIFAAAHGHVGTVRELVMRGAAVDVCGSDGETALCKAVSYNHSASLQELLAAGADVAARYRTKNGWTPLHLTICTGNLLAASALLDCGADPLAEDNEGRSPLVLAEDGEHRDAAALLLAHICAQPGGATSACADHQPAVVERLLSNSAVLAKALAVAEWRCRVALGEAAAEGIVRELEAAVPLWADRATLAPDTPDSRRPRVAAAAPAQGLAPLPQQQQQQLAYVRRQCPHASLRACLGLMASWQSIALAASSLPLPERSASVGLLGATEAAAAAFLRQGRKRTSSAAKSGVAAAAAGAVQPPAAPFSHHTPPPHNRGLRAPPLYQDPSVLPQPLHSFGPPRAVVAAAAGRVLSRCVAAALLDAPLRCVASLREEPFRHPADTASHAQYAAVRCVERWGELIAADRLARAAQAQAEARLSEERRSAAAAVEVLEAWWLRQQYMAEEAVNAHDR